MYVFDQKQIYMEKNLPWKKKKKKKPGTTASHTVGFRELVLPPLSPKIDCVLG